MWLLRMCNRIKVDWEMFANITKFWFSNLLNNENLIKYSFAVDFEKSFSSFAISEIVLILSRSFPEVLKTVVWLKWHFRKNWRGRKWIRIWESPKRSSQRKFLIDSQWSILECLFNLISTIYWPFLRPILASSLPSRICVKPVEYIWSNFSHIWQPVKWLLYAPLDLSM